MNKPLHLLHLEDDPDFAELVRTLLEQDDLDAEVKRVAGRAEFEAALNSEKFDVILSDFRLPGFTGLEALSFVRKEYPDLPFILVSGTIGEHAAIESLKAGATDYVLKHNPERLASSVRRAAQEALRSQQVVMADLHREAEGGPVYLSLMVPLVVRRESTGDEVPAAGKGSSPADRSAGLLVLQINANKELNPMIQLWPTSSRRFHVASFF